MRVPISLHSCQQLLLLDFFILVIPVGMKWYLNMGLISALKHVYYLGWNRSSAQVGCMRQALGPGALGRPRGSGWRGRWEGGLGWGTHVNPWLFHFNVWQNPPQIKKYIYGFNFHFLMTNDVHFLSICLFIGPLYIHFREMYIQLLHSS